MGMHSNPPATIHCLRARRSFVLSDVPYNLPANEISGKGKNKHADFVQAAGEITPHEFTRFLTRAMRLMAKHSRDGSLHAFFMSYHFLLELLRAGKIVYGRPKAICTWVKSQGAWAPCTAPRLNSSHSSRTEPHDTLTTSCWEPTAGRGQPHGSMRE